jgi:hypothetical protein
MSKIDWILILVIIIGVIMMVLMGAYQQNEKYNYCKENGTIILGVNGDYDGCILNGGSNE